MASNEKVIARAIIEVGATGVAGAQADIATLDTRLQRLEQRYQAGQITLSDYAKRTDDIKSKIKDLENGIDLADAAMKKHGSTQAALASLEDDVSKKTKGLQQSALAASYAIQDFTSANGGLVQQLASVNNNIPQIVAGLGGPVGLVAGIGTLTTVAIAAAPVIYDYAKSLGVLGEDADTTKGKIERMNERIQELQKKPVKLAIDTMELDRLQRKLKELQTAQQAFERFKGTKSEDQKQVGEDVEQLISMADGGASALSDKLAASMGKHLEANDSKLKDFQREAAEQTKKAEEFAAAAQASMNVGRPGIAAMQQKDAQKATEAANVAKEAAKNRRTEILGDDIIGKLGESHTEVGKLFQGATTGEDAARLKLVAELRKIGEKQLADEIASVNAHSVAVAKAEEQQEKNDNSMLQTNNFIRENRAKRQQIAENEQKELEKTQLEQAKPVIDAYVKGNKLEEKVTGIFGELKSGKIAGPDGKPMDPQQQIEFLQEQVRGVIEDELKSRGLLNEGSKKAAATAATQLAGHAPKSLEVQQENSKKLGRESAKKQVEKFVDAEDASIKASGIDKQATGWLAAAQAQGGGVVNGQFRPMSDDQILDYVKGQVARYLHRPMGQDQRGRTVFANPHMDRQTTDDVATKVAVGAKQDLTNRLTSMAGTNMSQTAKLLGIAGQLDIEVGQIMTNQANIGRAIDRLQMQVNSRARTAGKRG